MITPISKVAPQYQTIRALPKSSGFKEIYLEALQRNGCGIGKELKHDIERMPESGRR